MCKKRKRLDILIDIIRLNGDLDELKNELSKHPFDLEEPLLRLTKIDFYYVLNECIQNNITIDDLVKWMNIIEYRDDVDTEDEKLNELIFELASPEINGEITKTRLIDIINQLGNGTD